MELIRVASTISIFVRLVSTIETSIVNIHVEVTVYSWKKDHSTYTLGS